MNENDRIVFLDCLRVVVPFAITGIAAGSFAISSVASIVIRKIPFAGRWVVG